MAEQTCLIIAATPRSGSWLLADGLRRLDTVGRPEEYFAADAEPAYRELWRLAADGDFPTLLARIQRAGRTGNGVFAAKLHWMQLIGLVYRLRCVSDGLPADASDRELLEHHLGPLRVVYLSRTDTLRQAISWHMAIRSGRWWVTRDEEPPQETDDPIEFDFGAVTTLAALLTEYAHGWERWFERNDVVPIRLTYEQLAADYPGCLRAVASRLGLPAPAHIEPTVLTRQADDRTDWWVAQYGTAWHRVFGTVPLWPEWL